MAEAPQDPQQEPAEPAKKREDSPGKGDVIALGIGCAVFIVMFIAIVLVGMSGR